MEAGIKVVRGRDWKWGNQDEISGMVGTIIKVGMGKCQLEQNGTVFVCWDNGKIANYRIGRDNAYDLRLFDTGPVGSVHQSTPCSECKSSPLVGIRWQCAICDGVSLCSLCYGQDKHSVNHEFIRFDWPNSSGCKVAPRQHAEKIEAKGLFPVASVVRGPHWRWKDQDGGDGNRGMLMKTMDRGKGYKNWCEVVWSNGKANQYSIGGEEGTVDVISVEHGSGGYYYPAHLALFGSPDSYHSGAAVSSENDVTLKVGVRVQVNLDVEVFQAMQHGHGGWNPTMIGIIGCVGRILKIDGDGDAIVRYPMFPQPFAINPAALTVVKRGIRKGDKVRIVDDEFMALNYQEAHGGWNDSMRHTLGRIGTVVSSDNDFNLRVKIDSHVWTFSPGLCSLLTTEDTTPEKETVAESDSDGDAGSDSDDDDDDDDDDDVAAAIARRRVLARPQMTPFVHLLFGHQLIEAAGGGDVDRLRGILGRLSETGMDESQLNRALTAAAQKDEAAAVELLLKSGADVASVDNNGNTPVHIAASENGFKTLGILAGHPGCDLNARNYEGNTPLHIAVQQFHQRSVEKLLALGCNPNIVDEQDNTALHVAIQLGDNAIIELLTQLSVPYDFNRVNKRGFTVLQYAAQCNSALAVERILQRAQNSSNHQNNDGLTALHLACQGGHFEVAQALIQTGRANVEMKTVRNETCLLFAIRQRSAAIVELLLSNGANPNCPDSTGTTPLHVALSFCRQNVEVSDPHAFEGAKLISKILAELPTDLGHRQWVAVACYLVKCGADVGWNNSAGQTPLGYISYDSVMTDTVLRKTDAKRTGQCQVCSTKKTLVIFVPCGHRLVCADCSSKEKTCQKCRKEIERVFDPRPPTDKSSEATSDASQSEDSGYVHCEQCFKERKWLFRPCQHTCCRNCKKKIGKFCPFCNMKIKRPLIQLFATYNY